MERDLVTGGTGLVGSFLICDLLLKGKFVRALKRATSDVSWFDNVADAVLGDQKNGLLKNLEWLDGDIADQVWVMNCVEDCDVVYHTAALVSFSKKDKEALFRTNVKGTTCVVNACLSMDKKPILCHFSSTASIGSNGLNAADESHEFNKTEVSDYTKSKYLAELEAVRGREEGLSVAIINPCIILGFGNWNSGPSKFFANAKKGFPFYTSGGNAFVDVRDVTQCAIELVEKGHFDGRFLCTAHNATFLSVFKLMALKFNSKPPRILVKPWMAQVAWRLAALVAIFKGRALITKASTKSGMQTKLYNSNRLKQRLHYNFISLEETISWHVNLYKLFRS